MAKADALALYNQTMSAAVAADENERKRPPRAPSRLVTVRR